MGVRHGALIRAAAAVCALAVAAPAFAPAQAPDPALRRQRMQRLAEVVQQRLGLDERHAERLRATSGRYARERQALVAAERNARLTLRAEVQRGPDADQARVRLALDTLVTVHQRRAALLAAEQRDLSAFMTPVQRARYLGLQERAQRVAQRERTARLGSDDGDTAAPRRGLRRRLAPFAP